MEIINKPNCFNFDKCGKKALGLVGKKFLCGDCIILLQDKMEKLREDLLLEG